MANLIECPTCKQQISSNAASCPHCGEIIRKNKCRSKKGGFISLGVGLALCIAFGIIGNHVDESLALFKWGVFLLILGVVGACICFTSPSK